MGLLSGTTCQCLVFSVSALHTSHFDQGSNLLRMRGCFLGQSAPSLSASMVSLFFLTLFHLDGSVSPVTVRQHGQSLLPHSHSLSSSWVSQPRHCLPAWSVSSSSLSLSFIFLGQSAQSLSASMVSLFFLTLTLFHLPGSVSPITVCQHGQSLLPHTHSLSSSWVSQPHHCLPAWSVSSSSLSLSFIFLGQSAPSLSASMVSLFFLTLTLFHLPGSVSPITVCQHGQSLLPHSHSLSSSWVSQPHHCPPAWSVSPSSLSLSFIFLGQSAPSLSASMVSLFFLTLTLFHLPGSVSPITVCQHGQSLLPHTRSLSSSWVSQPHHCLPAWSVSSSSLSLSFIFLGQSAPSLSASMVSLSFLTLTLFHLPGSVSPVTVRQHGQSLLPHSHSLSSSWVSQPHHCLPAWSVSSSSLSLSFIFLGQSAPVTVCQHGQSLLPHTRSLSSSWVSQPSHCLPAWSVSPSSLPLSFVFLGQSAQSLSASMVSLFFLTLTLFHLPGSVSPVTVCQHGQSLLPHSHSLSSSWVSQPHHCLPAWSVSSSSLSLSFIFLGQSAQSLSASMVSLSFLTLFHLPGSVSPITVCQHGQSLLPHSHSLSSSWVSQPHHCLPAWSVSSSSLSLSFIFLGQSAPSLSASMVSLSFLTLTLFHLPGSVSPITVCQHGQSLLPHSHSLSSSWVSQPHHCLPAWSVSPSSLSLSFIFLGQSAPSLSASMVSLSFLTLTLFHLPGSVSPITVCQHGQSLLPHTHSLSSSWVSQPRHCLPAWSVSPSSLSLSFIFLGQSAPSLSASMVSLFSSLSFLTAWSVSLSSSWVSQPRHCLPAWSVSPSSHSLSFIFLGQSAPSLSASMVSLSFLTLTLFHLPGSVSPITVCQHGQSLLPHSHSLSSSWVSQPRHCLPAWSVSSSSLSLSFIFLGQSAPSLSASMVSLSFLTLILFHLPGSVSPITVCQHGQSLFLTLILFHLPGSVSPITVCQHGQSLLPHSHSLSSSWVSQPHHCLPAWSVSPSSLSLSFIFLGQSAPSLSASMVSLSFLTLFHLPVSVGPITVCQHGQSLLPHSHSLSSSWVSQPHHCLPAWSVSPS